MLSDRSGELVVLNRFPACVRRPRGDEGCAGKEQAADEECALVARSRSGGPWHVLCEQVRRVRGGDHGEDGEPQCRTNLKRRIDQSRGEAVDKRKAPGPQQVRLPLVRPAGRRNAEKRVSPRGLGRLQIAFQLTITITVVP